ncbi:hypothetical protein DICA4_F33166 [Diutina catenulata]
MQEGDDEWIRMASSSAPHPDRWDLWMNSNPNAAPPSWPQPEYQPRQPDFQPRQADFQPPPVKVEPPTPSPQVPQTPFAASQSELLQSRLKKHNRVEKKYRENINAKMACLQRTIPWTAKARPAFSVGLDPAPHTPGPPGKRLNKTEILDVATNYIIYLQHEVTRLTQENGHLRQELAARNP